MSESRKNRQSSAVREGRGLFITLEGGEGAGKSSQMKLLAGHLRELGHEVLLTREPGGSPGAEAVRHVLLSGAAEPFGAEMEAILFAAARSDHVAQVIEPALSAGKTVISDRFFDSTRVYQGIGGKVDPSLVRLLEKIACGDTRPDITVIIDLDPQEGLRRVHGRLDAGGAPDRFEKESLDLQERRRQAFLDIAREEPERCVVIDGSGKPETVAARIWKALAPRVGARPARKPKPGKAAKGRARHGRG